MSSYWRWHDARWSLIQSLGHEIKMGVDHDHRQSPTLKQTELVSAASLQLKPGNCDRLQIIRNGDIQRNEFANIGLVIRSDSQQRHDKPERIEHYLLLEF